MKANTKLNINLGEKYVIEVNEMGDTVVLYLEDVNMPSRFLKAYEELEKRIKEAQRQTKVIQKIHSDEMYNDFMTKAEYEYMLLMEQLFIDTRNSIDTLLGDENASKKIFGDVNSIPAFQEFFEQLQPIMKDVYGKQANLVEKYAEKYEVDESDILE